MKKLFSTPKKAIILVICIVVVIIAASVTAFKSTLITKAEAKIVALKDAGLSEAEASALRTRLEFDDGRFQYEVDFYNNGTEYEYLIQAKNGEIIARDIDGNGNGYNDMQDIGNQFAADGNSSVQPQKDAENQPAANGISTAQPQEDAENQPAANGISTARPQEDAENQPAANGISTTQPQEDFLDIAKAAALKDAGLSESDVTFKKTELDNSHGTQVYDIEFYTSDTKYDYEIDASNGTVLEKSIEQFQLQTPPTDSAINSSGNDYIGIDRAKEIALNHAQMNESDVQFAKAKLENDDGVAEYEIEFYFGRTEYDYTIDAVSGNIIEYDVEYD
jgi:uncharacterized membrane protein YkoI